MSNLVDYLPKRWEVFTQYAGGGKSIATFTDESKAIEYAEACRVNGNVVHFTPLYSPVEDPEVIKLQADRIRDLTSENVALRHDLEGTVKSMQEALAKKDGRLQDTLIGLLSSAKFPGHSPERRLMDVIGMIQNKLESLHKDQTGEVVKVRLNDRWLAEIGLLQDLIQAASLSLVYMQGEEEEGTDCTQDRAFVEKTIALAKTANPLNDLTDWQAEQDRQVQ